MPGVRGIIHSLRTNASLKEGRRYGDIPRLIGMSSGTEQNPSAKSHVCEILILPPARYDNKGGVEALGA